MTTTLNKETMTQEQIDEVLHNSIGTQHWYRVTPNLLYTDGIKYMAEVLEMNWFITMVASHMPAVMEDHQESDEWFYIVELRVDDNNQAVFSIVKEAYDDNDEYYEKNIALQESFFTDLPQCEMKFYLEVAQVNPTIFCLLQRTEH